MKILIVIDSLGAGGAEKSTLDFCIFLINNGYEVDLLCLKECEIGFSEIAMTNNIEVKILKSNFFFRKVFDLSKIITKNDYKIVYSCLFKSNLITRFCKLFSNFIHIENLVTTRYSKEKFEVSRNKIGFVVYFLIDLLTIRLTVDHFHSISIAVTKHYKKMFFISDYKFSTIYRGRPIPNYNQIEKNSNVIQLLTVGRQELSKGQIYLLQALKLLVENNYDINLTILGKKGSASEALEKFIFENNLQNYINKDCFVSDVENYYLKADIFIFPSIFEGLGGVLIEAQSYGLPIVCTEIDVFKELVIKDYNALMFKNKDYLSLYNCILKYITDYNLRVSHSKRSIENFNKNFEQIRIFESMINMFKDQFNYKF